MCICNPIPVIVSFGKCSNLITVSVKESFTLAKTVNKTKTINGNNRIINIFKKIRSSEGALTCTPHMEDLLV